MIELLGRTQQQLLKLLNKHKEGLSIAELVEYLAISRNAVKQHLVALEAGHLVEPGPLYRTSGRPRQSYVLTAKGREHFPRKYSWFAQVLMESIREEKGQKEFKIFLDKIGNSISQQYLPKLNKLSGVERVEEVASLLTELGYEADVVPAFDDSALSLLEISNCVFYHLAHSCPEICEFDLGLLSSLTGKKIEQRSCIASGASVCSFGVKHDRK